MEDQNHKTKSTNVINFNTGEPTPTLNTSSRLGQYKPNEDLMQSTARVKKQRDVIKERMQKMELAKERVTKNVYDKVKRDYSLQLQTISELLNEKKEELKKEVKELYLRREKITIEANRHREILEEAEFRLFLGEFSQNQFQEVENYETKEIEKLETDLSQLCQYIQTHEELFDPEEMGITIPKPLSETMSSQDTVTAQGTENEKTQKLQTKYMKPLEQEPERKPEPVSEPEPKPIAKKEPEPEPVAKKEPEAKPQPKEEPKETQDEISFDASEFEDLFLDDDDSTPDVGDSQTDILSQEKVAKEKKQRNDNQDDYFKDEKVSETSFNIASEDAQEYIDNVKNNDVEDSPTESRIQVPSLNKKPVAETKKEEKIETQTEVEAPTKKDSLESLDENSISDILNSLPTEDALPEEDNKSLPLEVEKPDTGSMFYLKLIDGEHEQKEFPLKDNVAIGRSPSSDIMLKAPKVSRQHAAINMYNNQYIIIDLKSSNGVYVNGTKIDECVLNPGDEVSIGGYRFKFTDKLD
ncbi:MAG: FHA domain-containing protein [bacterium]|nr:FHA domain-containing protein [bacterium]MBU1918561.1 FHA domain-containing protein [bacterium]